MTSTTTSSRGSRSASTAISISRSATRACPRRPAPTAARRRSWAAARSAAGSTAPGSRSFTTGTRNHLEPNLDDRDNLFTYDNTDDGLGWWTRVTHHIDGGYYGYPFDYHNRTDRMLPRMAEYGGGSPCGGVFYGEDAWPEKYRGRLFWAEWGQRSCAASGSRPTGRASRSPTKIDFVEPGDGRQLPPARPGASPRRQDHVHRRLVAGRLGQQDREARPGLRRDIRTDGRRGQDPPARQGLRPDRRPDHSSSTILRITSGSEPRRPCRAR